MWMLLDRFRRWREQRILQRYAMPEAEWQSAVAELPLLHGLDADERKRLRELATLFLYRKQVMAAEGYRLSEKVRLKIAAQACLPVLNLGLECYSGWVSVIVYPDEFVPGREYTDEAGVVHIDRLPMIGESWQRGPVILSAADVEHAGAVDGVNVVIHEFVHKLDMLNGYADGFPPLHRGMSAAAWTQAFTQAYEDFCRQVDSGAVTAIDPYAAENPAEFFAVISEVFFEKPHVLLAEYPQVYRQLADFYRQDPSVRF